MKLNWVWTEGLIRSHWFVLGILPFLASFQMGKYLNMSKILKGQEKHFLISVLI